MTIYDNHHIQRPRFLQNAIVIHLHEHSIGIIIQLLIITLKGDKAIKIVCLLSRGKNIITFTRIKVIGIIVKEEFFAVRTMISSDHIYSN